MPDLAEFTDPRLVAIYETVNPYTPDAQEGFYPDLARRLGATTIVDLGCGTGLITRDLARKGHTVIGADPSPGMLAQARRKPDGDRVHWIDGGAERLGSVEADLAIMTGHVAQFFLTDEDWSAALAALHGALRPGGHLAFESRNPLDRAWERWTRADSVATVVDPVAGPIETWADGHAIVDGIVSYTLHYRFAKTGEEVLAPSRLRFRSDDELRTSLRAAGFEVQQIYGNWDRCPAEAAKPELIVVAVR